MADIQEYKCPNCGGGIEFSSKSQKMQCPYCDAEFEIETLKEYDKELQNDSGDDMKWETQAGSEWQEGEIDGLHTYICKSCGGEIVGDASMAATTCPYCDNPVVLMDKFSGTLRPDYIIPFKLDKKAAKAALKKHLEGKRLLPKVFKDENHIDEIKGIYVPFWLFDADANADIRYRGIKVRRWQDQNYIYTKTNHYLINRSGTLGFNHVPVDGSSKMADDLMESLEPYDFSEAVDFQTAYLAGYLADKYDVDADQSAERANERIKHSTEDMFAGTVTGYQSVTPEMSSIRLSNGNAKYTLYPVWLLNTMWEGKRYVFAMNGQTGKFVGDLPVDKRAARRWKLLLTPLFSAIVYVIMWLLWLLMN